MDEPVDFPIEGLDVGKYVKMDCKAQGISTVYDLYGIVNHFGNLNGGHYTATIKSPLDGQWYYYNDSSVSQAGSGKIMNDAAYILFYRRRDNAETMKKSEPASTTASTPTKGGSSPTAGTKTTKSAASTDTGFEEEKED